MLSRMRSRTGSYGSDQAHAAHAAMRSAAHGILLFLGASVSFACMNTLAKYASQGLHVIEVTWGRYAFSLLLVALLVPRVRQKRPFASARPLLQVVRSALLLGVTALFFAAISLMPLVDAAAIGQTTPLMITALAGVLLGERVGFRQWAAVVAGFIGVLVVMRPGFGAIEWAAVLMLGAAALNALYHLATRMLASIDPPETTIIYTGVVGSAVLTAALPIFWTTPEPAEIALLAGLGFLGFLSQYLLILAYARAPASTLAPYTFLITVWLGLLGYTVFGELPDVWTIAGTLMIVGSGFYIYQAEAQSHGRARAAPQTGEEIDEIG